MITFDDIKTYMQQDLKQRYCIEICFSVRSPEAYSYCWMGKMPDPGDKSKDLYWYGLTADGSKAYDYDSFDAFSSAPVFDGKSLQEVWNDVEIDTINGCDPETYLYHCLHGRSKG